MNPHPMIRLAWLVLVACGDDPAAVEPDAGAVAPHQLYLVFDGATITSGSESPADDRSSVLAQTFIAPPFLDGDPDRAATIAAALAGVDSVLAPYAVEVVTERPSEGVYDMLVLGGTSEAAGLGAELGAVMPFLCGEDDPNVGFVFDGVADPEDLAYTIVAALGVLNQIPFSDVPGDCMCWADAGCALDGELCAIGGAGTSVDSATWTCESITEMDEHARFVAAFGDAP